MKLSLWPSKVYRNSPSRDRSAKGSGNHNRFLNRLAYNLLQVPIVWIFFVGWVHPSTCQAWQASDPPNSDTSLQIPPKAKQIIANSCLDCHQGSEPEAGLDLSGFQSLQSIRNEPDTWKKVFQRIVSENMPPEDSVELSKTDRKWIAQWVDKTLHEIDCTGQTDVGKVTIRRLTKREYRNTINDLLKIDYRPAAGFPGDDTGYGFDNIGDVLSLPPVLMEKYLTAAEFISRKAIPAPEDFIPPTAKLNLQNAKRRGGLNDQGGALSFFSNGSATFELGKIPPGKYHAIIHASATQAGTDICEMNFYFDKRKIKTEKVPGHRLPKTFKIPFKVRHRKHKLVFSFENDFYAPDAVDRNRRDRNLMIHSISIVGPSKPLAENQKNLFLFDYPKNSSEQTQKAKRLLSVWSNRLFRRPTTKKEIQNLMKLYNLGRSDGGSFERGLQVALQGILVSPKFLFKVESPAKKDRSPEPLDDFELATRLSFFLWNSTPDNELLRTAHKEDLQDPVVLKKQISRLLSDPKADRFIHDFSEQWLQLRALELSQPDPKLFRIRDPQILEDMSTETQLFFAEFVHNNLPISQLLTAKFSFLNRRLAGHYGLQRQRRKTIAKLVKNDTQKRIFSGFQKIDLRGTVRGGLLTQGSFLTATSNPTRTSPVKRGKWIMENLLGDEPPPPSADVMALEQQQLTGTLRQRMEQHRVNPACASCHQVMDPLGFSLERFDAVGRLRDKDAGLPIDDRGELPSGEKFQGAVQLREMLAKSKKKEFLRTITEKMMIYAIGRGLRYEDQCTINDITRKLQKDDRIGNLIEQIILSPSFRKKQK